MLDPFSDIQSQLDKLTILKFDQQKYDQLISKYSQGTDRIEANLENSGFQPDTITAAEVWWTPAITQGICILLEGEWHGLGRTKGW